MINMKHCRFENTLEALYELHETINETYFDVEGLSEAEQNAMKKMVPLLKMILDELDHESGG